jgi:hypothetical protein
VCNDKEDCPLPHGMGCDRPGCECYFMAKSGRGIQIQIIDLLLLAVFQRGQTHCMGNSFFATTRHCTILANDVVFVVVFSPQIRSTC